MDLVLFLIFATIAVVAAVNVIRQTHPISSALSLVGVMVSLAVLYLLLGAEFIAAAQIVVYAGAVMVLFIFVIMLLNTGEERQLTRAPFAKWLGLPALVSLAGLFVFMILTRVHSSEQVRFGGFDGGGPREIGLSLFSKYLLPFEVTSILILIALIGAVVLAKKEID